MLIPWHPLKSLPQCMQIYRRGNFVDTTLVPLILPWWYRLWNRMQIGGCRVLRTSAAAPTWSCWYTAGVPSTACTFPTGTTDELNATSRSHHGNWLGKHAFLFQRNRDSKQRIAIKIVQSTRGTARKNGIIIAFVEGIVLVVKLHSKGC